MNVRPVNKRAKGNRAGVTLLELVIASTMLGVMATSLSTVLRTSRSAWETNDNEHSAQYHGQAVVLHFVRQAREARAVVSIAANAVTLQTNDGQLLTWSHESGGAGGNVGTVYVNFAGSGSKSPLAHGIRNLSFTGYLADGLTPTNQPDKIQVLEITATIEVAGNSIGQQNATCRVWIRSW